MRKFDKLVKQVAEGVENEIRESIAAGWDSASYEQDFGNTTVMVEVELVGRGIVVQINDVWIEREDSEHASPLVIEAIKKALPDWIAIDRQVEEEQSAYKYEAEYMMN